MEIVLKMVLNTKYANPNMALSTHNLNPSNIFLWKQSKY
jgi:hypothetical protein